MEKTYPQLYAKTIKTFIITCNASGMNMQDLYYGYKLYLEGKKMNQNESASILANYLMPYNRPVEMKSVDDAIDVIQIREDIEEKENNEFQR